MLQLCLEIPSTTVIFTVKTFCMPSMSGCFNMLTDSE